MEPIRQEGLRVSTMLTRKTNLLLVAAVVLLIPFFVLSYVNFKASREWAVSEITTSALPLTRDNIYSEIHADLAQPLYVASTMANDSFLKAWTRGGETDDAEITRYLKEIQDKYHYFSVFFVSDKTKHYYHFKGLHKTVTPSDAHDDWYYDFLSTGREYRLEIDTDEAASNVLTIFINFRVVDSDGKLLGVTGVGMKLETVARLLASAEGKYGRRIYLTDSDGVIQAHPDTSLAGTASIRNHDGIRTIASGILASVDHVSDFQYEGPGGNVLLTVRYIPEFNWFLIVEQDETDALTSARNNFKRTLAVGIAIWIVIVAATVYEVHRHRRQLEHFAHTDLLTGLANRRRFKEDFECARSRFERGGTPFTLFLIDLDAFKPVNDSLGHLIGDQTLKAISQALQAMIRPADRLARWGGDEFIILAECDEAGARPLAARLRGATQEAVRMLCRNNAEDPRYHVSMSCGAVIYRTGMALDDMTRLADTLLYQAKKTGDCVVFAPPADA